MDVEAVACEVDAEGAHATCDLAPGPAVEDAAAIGAEGDDVPEFLQLLERFIDLHVMALAVALDGGPQTTEP